MIADAELLRHLNAYVTRLDEPVVPLPHPLAGWDRVAAALTQGEGERAVIRPGSPPQRRNAPAGG